MTEKRTAGPLTRYDPFPGSRPARSGAAALAWGPRRTRAQEHALASHIVVTVIVLAVIALGVVGAYWSATQ